MRIAAGVEYDGSGYAGWQAQKDKTTVQGLLEDALSFVANCKISIVTAGRTDSNVHACNQVIHFDVDVKRTEYSWVLGVNTFLKNESIRLLWVKEVSLEFSARYSALQRTYQYYVYNHTNSPALLHNNITWSYKNLSIDKMKKASEYLLGEHDFSSFRASGCQAKTPIRTLSEIKINKHGRVISFEISANAFLYHMVRNIIGLLLKIGSEDELSAEHANKILLAKDRTLAPDMADAKGLYLVDIKYPEEFAIPGMEKPWFFFPAEQNLNLINQS